MVVWISKILNMWPDCFAKFHSARFHLSFWNRSGRVRLWQRMHSMGVINPFHKSRLSKLCCEAQKFLTLYFPREKKKSFLKEFIFPDTMKQIHLIGDKAHCILDRVPCWDTDDWFPWHESQKEMIPPLMLWFCLSIHKMFHTHFPSVCPAKAKTLCVSFL